MKIELNIVPKVPEGNKNPRNTYQLHVDVEHGDADFGETNTQYFTDDKLDKLIKYLQLLSCYWEVDKTDYPCNTNVMQKALELKGKQIDYDNPTDVWCDMVGYDRTNDGQSYCSVENVWITYFDYNGIECDVEIEIEGEKSLKFSRSFFSSISK